MAQASLQDILTAQWVKDNFLFGVDFRDNFGNPFPDSLFTEALKSAITSVENDLDVTVDPVQTIDERHDMDKANLYSRWSILMRKRPFIGLDAVKLKYGNMELAVLPKDWGTCLQYTQSDFHIIPQTSNQMTAIQPILLPSLAIYSWNEIPGYVSLSYRSGCRVFTGEVVIPAGERTATIPFAEHETFLSSNYATIFELVDPVAEDANIVTKVTERVIDSMTIQVSRAPTEDLTVQWYATDIPDNLRRLIGIRAAKGPLAIAGDLVLGAGVQSYTVGLDGMTQGKVSSKRGRGAYGDRLANLEVEEAALRLELQKMLGTFNITAI